MAVLLMFKLVVPGMSGYRYNAIKPWRVSADGGVTHV